MTGQKFREGERERERKNSGGAWEGERLEREGVQLGRKKKGRSCNIFLRLAPDPYLCSC